VPYDLIDLVVQPDHTILVLDPVSGCYSRHHDHIMTPRLAAEAVRQAKLVWAGTHYTIGGSVFPLCEGLP
jgi:LmbE family N-acetylglucosaminyl deacetylase